MLTFQFYKTLKALTKSKNICIALSGGLDSVVLLHLLAQQPDLNLRAIHVNHGLSPNASNWQHFCEQICKQYNIPLQINAINIEKINQKSLEDLARQGRYQVFKNTLTKNELLVTAHHLDDQAETVLLQLFRGCGPKGLAAMPKVMQFGLGQLARPLLDFSKEDLRAYANSHHLIWVEDESNENCTFDRNFVRQNLLPLIQSRWPTVTENIARTAHHCANSTQFIEQQIACELPTLLDESKRCLTVSLLLTKDEITQSYIIRYWLGQLQLPLPNSKKLATLLTQLRASQDSTVLVEWQDVSVRRYDNFLYAFKTFQPHDSKLILPWDCQSDFILPNDLGVISLTQLSQQGLEIHTLKEVTIRFRQGGERCRLTNRKHSHSLKKLFQTWRVPPWQRDRIPLLYDKEQLKAIIGFAICQ